MLCLFIYVFGFSLILPAPADAYLDAGTGSFILQIVAGAFFVVLATIRIYYKKIKSFFGLKTPKIKNDQEDETRNGV